MFMRMVFKFWKRLKPFSIDAKSSRWKVKHLPLSVMMPTKPTPRMRLAAYHARRSSMIRSMFFVALAKYKIFRSVIITNSVNVVADFVAFKIATKFFFHHEPVFKNPTRCVCVWVKTGQDSNVSVNSFCPTSFVCWFMFWMQSVKFDFATATTLRLTFTREYFSNLLAANSALSKCSFVTNWLSLLINARHIFLTRLTIPSFPSKQIS